MENHLKLVSSDQNKAICVLCLLILWPEKVDLVLKKERSNKNSIEPSSNSDSKVILIFLKKVVTFYMRLTTIYF